MVQVGRPELSYTQKNELWRKWEEGQSLTEIGRALRRHGSTIYDVVKTNGVVVPVERSRAARVLSLFDWEEISRGLAQGRSIRTIISQARPYPSTIGREIGSHAVHVEYRVVRADDQAWRNSKRPKTSVMAENLCLQQVVPSKLKDDGGPVPVTRFRVL